MTKPYRFLPFRFERKDNKVLLVNDVGDYCFLDKDQFHKFIKMDEEFVRQSEDFINLQSKFMLSSDCLSQTLDLLSTRYRTKKQFLYDFTSLHMFVVTQRCNLKCAYCHASSVDEACGKDYDMSVHTAHKCVNLALSSPSKHIKIEFQGGEPLLNFDTVKEIVEYAKEANKIRNKHLEFVICTNLTIIDEHQIDYLKQNNICVSTSLDGPLDIHDKCRRTRVGSGTYSTIKEKLSCVMEIMGHDKVSSLVTVTSFSVDRLREVVDEYIQLGLSSIFLRAINPYGRASKYWKNLGYTIEEFVVNYKLVLDYIIHLNLSGIYFTEEFATLLLTRILTPFPTGFVDLQSPTGAGIGGVIYETNGDVYIADEARMLSKMNGNKIFCLGNVHSHSWEAIFCCDKLKGIIEESCIEATPGCAWCVYQTYCGSDPVRNYIQFGNISGHGMRSDFCRKHRSIFNILFGYLQQNNDNIEDVFWSWISSRRLSEISI